MQRLGLAPRALASALRPRGCTEAVASGHRWRASAAEEFETEIRSDAHLSWGTRFLKQAREYAEKEKNVGSDRVDSKLSGITVETIDPEDQVRLQLQNLFKELPGKVSLTRAYILHSKKGKLHPKVWPPLSEGEFEPLYMEERRLLWNGRRKEIKGRRNKRKNHFLLNAGYQEEDDVYEAEEEEFDVDWRTKSILEDCWKADFHSHLHRLANQMIPERQPPSVQPLAIRTDRIADVLGSALRSHVTEQNRPVLTHELADFENPYMSKRSTLERLLQERCVRNQLDERCLPRVLEKLPSLVKLRSEASLPPEVLEPLAAFRGDTRWHFDTRERLAQKLSGVDLALKAVLANHGDVSKVADAVPENAETQPDQVPGVTHPWQNHVSFETAVPNDFAGGTRMGQPLNGTDTQVRRLRYPTLQRVAHTLPKDPKWRSHVVRSLQVLERSKHWDFRSKLRAINSMKEVYDNMRSSEHYTEKLDEKLVLNRVPSHLKRRYARDAQYIKTFPKKFMAKKTHEWYRASLTAVNPKKKKAS